MVPIRPGSKPHAANNSLGPLGHYYMELVSARGGLKILSQENKIQRLNDQVQDLRRQLVQCRNENHVELMELVTELNQLPLSGNQLPTNLMHYEILILMDMIKTEYGSMVSRLLSGPGLSK
ncbi:hypothetical protein YC2023_120654 [Brassica napus]